MSWMRTEVRQDWVSSGRGLDLGSGSRFADVFVRRVDANDVDEWKKVLKSLCGVSK